MNSKFEFNQKLSVKVEKVIICLMVSQKLDFEHPLSWSVGGMQKVAEYYRLPLELSNSTARILKRF